MFSHVTKAAYPLRRVEVFVWRFINVWKLSKAVGSLLTAEPSVSVISAAAPHRFRDVVVQMNPDLLLGKLGSHSIEDLHQNVSHQHFSQSIADKYL